MRKKEEEDIKGETGGKKHKSSACIVKIKQRKTDNFDKAGSLNKNVTEQKDGVVNE